jgi:hypothetical protein
LRESSLGLRDVAGAVEYLGNLAADDRQFLNRVENAARD